MLERADDSGMPRGRRPTRDEIDPAALELIERHGPAVLRAARRYSHSAEDAEDAYQRGLEILLTKAPSTSEEDLVPWLKTVVKHEAYAIRRQREKIVAGDEEGLDQIAAPALTEERAEHREQLRIGAEALAQLKPHEVECLLLLANGFSYRQISDSRGWTYTKVNRLATEGRRALRARVRAIETGNECERLAPKLSALADREASAEDVTALRRHLRGCPACRLTLGDYRTMPARVAAITPPLLATDAGGLGNLATSVWEWVQERAYWMVLKLQSATEMATTQKAAAVAASTAVIAGGGVGAVKTLERDEPDRERRVSARSEAGAPSAGTPAVPTRSSASRPRREELSRQEGSRRRPRANSERRPPAAARKRSTATAASPARPGPTKTTEFERYAATPSTGASTPPGPSPASAGREFGASFESAGARAGSGGSASTRSAGGGEFGE